MAGRQVASIAQEIDRNLRVVRQILRRPVDATIARGGLTGPQKSAMHVLVRSGAVSLKNLSQEMGLAHSTVSGIVDRLAKQGLVERQADEADRRFSKIVVSDEVRTFLRDTWPSLEVDPLVEALRGATPSERQEILQGIRLLRQVLERQSANACGNRAASAQQRS
jgi:DNA-binding MarR family transcriptional regulator